MPEPFKNNFNKKLIKKIATNFKKQDSTFNELDFVKTASSNLEKLELKERSEQIMNAMIKYFPKNYKKTGKFLLNTLGPELNDKISNLDSKEEGLHGWALMPMSHFVGVKGHNDFKLSMKILKAITKRFTSEFAIRFFLLESSEKTLKQLMVWTKDKDHHVRRLASEGCRPRLPWAMMLPEYIKNPKLIIPILELLKDDSSEYVRRSVANNLNDISKDHPDLVAGIATKWLVNASIERKKLVKHACRGLIKSGHKKTLKAFGFNPPKLKPSKIKILNSKVKFGTALNFEVQISSNSKVEQSLVIDYIIHHQKANGLTSPKVYKWKSLNLLADSKQVIVKRHKFVKITTRVYYPGQHALEIMVNGKSIGKKKFELKM